MFVCICNQITDKEIKQNLSQKEGTVLPTDIDGVETFYQCCSNGEASNCGQCLEMVCDFMTDHNKAAQSAQNLSDAINQFAEQKSEQHETVKTEEPV